MIRISVHFKCPHCGTPDAMINPEEAGLITHYCDIEQGGCDQPFVIEVPYQEDIKVRTFTIYENPFDSEEQP